MPEGSATPGSVGHYESVSLFCDRAAEVSGFELTDNNAEAVAQLCAHLEGVPLAIELAAGRTVGLSPQTMLDQLTDRFRLLSTPHPVSADRHRSVRACAAWSYDLCSEAEQELWRRLSVFAGGCDLTTVETVCTGGAVPPDDVLDVLLGLVEKSILYVESHDDPDGLVRYRMLDDIAEFGLEALAATGDLERWQRRHVLWCADRAAAFRAGWTGPEQAGWLRRMRAEHDNLRAALARCAADRDLADLGFALTTDLDQFWLAAGLDRRGKALVGHGAAPRAPGAPGSEPSRARSVPGTPRCSTTGPSRGRPWTARGRRRIGRQPRPGPRH